MRLIRRKTEVPAPATAPPRRRLDLRLMELSAEGTVTAVFAAAGAGKTTAITAFAGGLTIPVAWLTVDAQDQDPDRLAAYLEAALQRSRSDHRVARRAPSGPDLTAIDRGAHVAEGLDLSPALLVIDDLDRIDRAEEAGAMLRSFVLNAPATLRIILAGRREPAFLVELGHGRTITSLPEGELAFTAGEAEAAIPQPGRGETATFLLERTGGWVQGVIFEAALTPAAPPQLGAWEHSAETYLEANVLADLPVEDVDFLVKTSLLEEVTAERAAALALSDGPARLASLRRRHLPIRWSVDGGAMSCVPVLRDHLLVRFEQLPGGVARSLRRLWAGRLMAEGEAESATEEFLRCGDYRAARRAAESAVLDVVERLDLRTASRWLQHLAPTGEDGPCLTVARLMVAVCREDYRAGVEVADGLARRGSLDRLAAESDLAAALMAWCYSGAGRYEDVERVFIAAGLGPALDAVRYGQEVLVASSGSLVRPPLSGSPLDAFSYAGDYLTGRLLDSSREHPSRWAEAVMRVWRMGALRAMGRTTEALTLLYEDREVGTSPGHSLRVSNLIGPEVLIDAGRPADARSLLADGRTVARTNGSRLFLAFNFVVEAKLALRVDRDPALAHSMLDRAEEVERRSPLVKETIDTWRALAFLLEGRHEDARARARAALGGMIAADRLLERPTAAVYLAEAAWACGADDEADRAAEVAIEAARRQGSNHVLLQALEEFPAVVSRRLDLDPGADSPWTELGRRLLNGPDPAPGIVVRDDVRLFEFGAPEIHANGEPLAPRIAKATELLGYLAARERRPASRDVVLEALFGGRVDDSARAYLRQAIGELRKLLPGRPRSSSTTSGASR